MHGRPSLMTSASRVGLLRLIAAFKLFKALVLLGSLATVFDLVRQDDPVHALITWALALHVDPHNRYLRSFLAAVFDLNPRQFTLLAVGTVLYAVLFTIEGIGLWLAKRWAEYLTVIATVSFIPLEVYELIHGIAAAKMVALTLNVAIVAYLIVQLRRR
jgi:uncharacterized membrane protein (DUF2068 family)